MSDWGGEMWWCCGKREKEQLGCKFSKHESKDDDDFAIDPTLTVEEKTKVKNKNVRCMCCKQHGHTIDKCIRDPKYKTNIDFTREQERLSKIKDYRKLHADTLINTTHFIKKTVMIPYDLDEEGQT